MKIAEHSNALETNAQVKSQDFGIGNASKIIGILRNFLYEHKARTMIQEYMSNARDAQRENKSTKKIIVTVPNQLNPVFKVRDFGPGITPQRMTNVFLQYGNSTKEGTNSQTGGFGIGAKSAWAYTDSFTIVSITDGMKRTYVAHTGVNHQGRLDEIGCDPTDEETGTEIHVAVKSGDIQQFRNAIWRACHFWRDAEYPVFKGVLAHEVPERKQGLRIGDLELINGLPSYLELETNSYHEAMSMVIDGIPYKMGRQLIRDVKELRPLLQDIHCDVLVHIGNGVMDIPATRESISNESINKEILAKLAPKLHKQLGQYAKSEFDKAKGYSAWVKKYIELSDMITVDQYAVRGDYSIKGELVYSKLFSQFNLFEAGTGRRGGFKREKKNQLDLDQLGRVFYIDDPDEPMVRQNRRMKDFASSSGVKNVVLIHASEHAITSFDTETSGTDGKKTAPVAVTKVVTTFAESEKALNKFLKDFGGKALSTLPYTAPVRAARKVVEKEKESFTLHRYRWGRKNLYNTTLERIDSEGENFLYVAFKDWNKYKTEFRNMNDFVEGQGYTLVAVSPKVLKLISSSKRFTPYDKWLAAFKPDAKLIASACAHKAKNAAAMKLLSQATEKIADPILDVMLETYKTILKSNPEKLPPKIHDTVSKEVIAFEKDDAALTKLLGDSYPLVNMVESLNGSKVANELVCYINSKV